jgi:hypothetical protein
MALPPLPKALRSFGADRPDEAYRRIDQWAKGTQELQKALRDGNPALLRRLDDLEARPIGGGGGVTDHGALTGLGDDDHTQYLRTDGSRPLTGDQSAGSNKITDLAAPTNPNDAARLADVPGSISYGAHVDLTVGGAGTDGSNTTVSRSDHVHGLPAFGSGAGTFAEGNHTHSGLGSGYVDVWNPYLPPATAHAADDMMDNGTAIDAKWTTHDPSGCIDVISATTNPRRYKISKLNTANGIGLRQAVSGFESMSMVVRVSAPEACYAAGLAIGFGTGTTDDYRIVGLGGTTTVPEVRTALVAGTRAVDGTSLVVSRVNMIGPWFRMRAIFQTGNTNMSCECSADGEHWAMLLDSSVVLTTASWFGIMIHGPNTSHSTALFSNFQAITSNGAGAAAWDALLPGRMQRVALP